MRFLNRVVRVVTRVQLALFYPMAIFVTAWIIIAFIEGVQSGDGGWVYPILLFLLWCFFMLMLIWARANVRAVRSQALRRKEQG